MLPGQHTTQPRAGSRPPLTEPYDKLAFFKDNTKDADEQFDPNVYYYRDREAKLFDGVPGHANPMSQGPSLDHFGNGVGSTYPISMYPPSTGANRYALPGGSYPQASHRQAQRQPVNTMQLPGNNYGQPAPTAFVNGNGVTKGQADWRTFQGNVPANQMNGMKSSTVSYPTNSTSPGPSSLRLSSGNSRGNYSNASGYRTPEPIHDVSMSGMYPYTDTAHVRRLSAEYADYSQHPQQMGNHFGDMVNPSVIQVPSVMNSSTGSLDRDPDQRERERREREFPALPGYGGQRASTPTDLTVGGSNGVQNSSSQQSHLSQAQFQQQQYAPSPLFQSSSTLAPPHRQSAPHQSQKSQQWTSAPSQGTQQGSQQSSQQQSVARSRSPVPTVQSQQQLSHAQQQPHVSQLQSSQQLTASSHIPQFPQSQAQIHAQSNQPLSQSQAQIQAPQSNQFHAQSASQLSPSRENYALTGLLRVLKLTDRNLSTLASGIDLTTLGLNLSSPDVLYPTFASPFSDARIEREPEFHIPGCYYMRPPLPPPMDKMSLFSDETLFYIFYSMPRDSLQLAAAGELQARDWTYHSEQSLWFQRLPGASALTKTNTYEQGSYIYFDTQYWEKRRKVNFRMEYSKLFHLKS